MTGGQPRLISFDTQLPYMYLPDADFENLAEALGKFDQTNIICSYTMNYCKFATSCDKVTESQWDLTFTVFDSLLSKDFKVSS